MGMKVWIVCEEDEDKYYAPHPTGEVFTDEEKARAYIEGVNANPKTFLFYRTILTLVEGEMR